MKAIVSITVAILLFLSLCGCSSTTDSGNTVTNMYKQAAQNYIDSGDTASAIKALEEGIAATQDETLKKMLEDLKTTSTTAETAPTTTGASNGSVTTTVDVQTPTTATPTIVTTTTTTTDPKVDCANYNGEWATSGFGWESGGFHLSFDVEGSVISITCSEVQANTSRLAEVSVVANTSMLIGDVLTIGFEDSWGNRGMLKLTFKSGQIVCSISDVQQPDVGIGWGLNEGENVLTPYKKTSANVSYDDIVDSYVDIWGNGFYMDIAYTDSTKQQAFIALYLAAGDYEVPIVSRDGNSISAKLMSSGSEPICLVDLEYSPFDGYIVADIYISSLDYSDSITFCPLSHYN